METPKTLTEAREQLDEANANIASLQSLVAAYESDAVLLKLGVVRVTNEAGDVHFESPVLADYVKLVTDGKAHAALLENEKGALFQQVTDLNAKLAELSKRNAELEASAKTVETRAREMVASQGGKPLAIDTNEQVLTATELRTRLDAEKDTQARGLIYKQLKALEAEALEAANARLRNGVKN